MIDLYPHGIHVADHTDGMLSLHAACANSHRMLDTISLLVEADLFTIVQNSQRGTPYQMAWRWSNTNVEIERRLMMVDSVIGGGCAATVLFVGMLYLLENSGS